MPGQNGTCDLMSTGGFDERDGSPCRVSLYCVGLAGHLCDGAPGVLADGSGVLLGLFGLLVYLLVAHDHLLQFTLSRR